VKREANRRNGDRTNNSYNFDPADKRAIAKELTIVIRDIKELVHASKEARKPTSKGRKLAYAVGAVAVAAGLYSQSNLILSALPKIVAVAKGVYPAGSAKLAYLKGVPKAIASSTQSVALKNKAKVASNAIRAMFGSTAKAAYSYVPNGVKSSARAGYKATRNYLAPYLAQLRRAKLPQSKIGTYYNYQTKNLADPLPQSKIGTYYNFQTRI
jgi:hypothetical protein